MLATILMERLRAAGHQLEIGVEFPVIPNDDAENGGKIIVITARGADGHTHIVRGPNLTLALVQMAINLGFDLEA